jgi:hypothetical protein
MAITQTMTDKCKENLLKGDIHFDSDTFKIALYDSTATLDASTAAFAGVAGELADGVGGYSTGGNTLSGAAITVSDNVAFVDFADSEWTSSTFTARGALIYQSGGANSSIAVLDFGSDKTSSNSTFAVTFPAASATTAIIRIE